MSSSQQRQAILVFLSLLIKSFLITFFYKYLYLSKLPILKDDPFFVIFGVLNFLRGYKA